DKIDVEFGRGDLKLARRRAQLEVESAHRVVFSQAKAFDRAMRHLEQRSHVRIVAIAEELSVARDEVDEALERGLDFSNAGEDIRVIEFQVVEQGHFRQVV